MADDSDRTASLMTPARLAQLKVRPQPAASPGAWLDQLAADAGSGHARRLVDLRRQLEAQARERGYAGVQGALQALEAALAQLDFDLLQPKGWLARATGKGKEQGAGFVAQYERAVRAGEDLKDEVRELQRGQQAQNTAAERTLAEFDGEIRAIEKIIDQGARWLQDMRNQLKEREAQGGDAAAMQEDEARCEVLVARLKQLRAASSAAQQAAERSRAAAARRAALLATLQQALEGDWQSWHDELGPVAAAAGSTGAAAGGVEDARSATQALHAGLRQPAQDCLQLQAQEQALAAELAGLHEPLQAAA